MQFQIPQFIEVEAKIVGPLTLKQFMYLAAAGGISFASFFIFQTFLFVLITMFVGVIGIALAFIRYNGQPLPKIILFAFGFFWKPRLYIWQRMPEMRALEIPEYNIEEKRKSLKEYFTQMPSVKKLWTDLMTSKGPIAKREKGVPSLIKPSKEKIAAFRKITGEKEIARRVDFR